MSKKQFFKFIPFKIATLLVLISIIEVLVIPNFINEIGQEFSFEIIDSVIYALFGLIVVLFFIIQRSRYWSYAFGILLVIGFTPLIKFYNQSFLLGIGFLKIDLITLSILIFHLKMNKEVLDYILNFLKPSEEAIEKSKERQIKNFEERFSKKNISELEKIINSKLFLPEAKEAAKRLLNEKIENS